MRSRAIEKSAFLCLQCLGKRERSRPTSVEAFVEKHGDGECCLLMALYKLDERLRHSNADTWIGLNLIDPPERYDSDAVPVNTIAFAQTGGDSVHFNLVSRNGRVGDASPVVITVPCAAGTAWDKNFVVGENLREFLRLGCLAGFDPLEDLAYCHWSQVASRLMTGPAPEASDEQVIEMLSALRRELRLTPCADIERRLRELDGMKRSILSFC